MNLKATQQREWDELYSFFRYWSERPQILSVVQRDHPGHPLNVLTAIRERMGPAMAMKSLRMGVNDVTDATSELTGAKLDLLNAELSAAGVLTLSELRRRYSSKYAQILKRGKVRNETEYYMVKNIVDGSSDSLEEGELTLLNRMMAEFEQRS